MRAILAVDMGEDRLGQVVLGRRGMIVDGDLDVVFLDQLLEQGEVVIRRLADDGPDAHLAGEVEDLAHAFFGLADVDDTVAVEVDAGRLEPVLDLGHLRVVHVLVELGSRELGRESLAGECLDGGDTQLLELEQGLGEGELAEGPGLRGEGEGLDPDRGVVGLGHGLLQLGRDVADLRGSLRGRDHQGRQGKDGQSGQGEHRLLHNGFSSFAALPGPVSAGPSGSRSPWPPRGRNCPALRAEGDGLAGLGAHVGGHQQLGHGQAVREVLLRPHALEEALDHMPVLGDVTVLGGFVGHHGHQTDLGVLLLDQVLAGLALDLAAEEDLQPGVQGVDLQGVLRPQQLHAQPQAGPDVAPGGGRLDDQDLALGGRGTRPASGRSPRTGA